MQTRHRVRHLAFSITGIGRFVLALLLTGFAVSSVRAEATPEAPASNLTFSPLVQSVLSTPHWFTGTDGVIHLTYELLVTNAIALPLTISTVEVLDADTNATLQHLTGEALLAAMSLAAVPGTPAVLLPRRPSARFGSTCRWPAATAFLPRSGTG